MNHFIIALTIGIVAGLIDVIPMIIRKLDRVSCVSAFTHYVALGLIIPFVNWGIPLWITGMIIALLTAIPIMVIVYPKDKKAIIPMILFSFVLGAGIGVAATKFMAY